MKTEIKAEKAPTAIGPYSQAIVADGFMFLSGQLPIEPVSGTMPSGIAAQTGQVLQNVIAVLSARGLTLSDVVKSTVYLRDMQDFADMNSVYAAYFTAPYPARATIGVAALPKGALVEIDCIAVTGKK